MQAQTQTDYDKVRQLIDEADRLMAQIQRDSDDQEDSLRRLGLDPAKVRSIAAQQLSPRDREQAEAAFRADLDAVEQEVQAELARRSFQTTPAAAPRRPRTMI